MAYSSGAIIYGADYNAVQIKIVEVLGSGTPYGPGTASPNYGYNQTVTSSTVAIGAIITASQFQLMADDINKCYVHQTGASFTGYAASTDSQPFEITGNVVYAANLNLLDTTINTCITNRLVAAATQLASVATTYWRTTNWGGVVAPAAIAQTNTITFASTAAAQYWFNQGGQIVFQGTYRGTPPTTQDTAWKNEVTAFTYTIDVTSYAGLTTTPTNKYTGAGAAPYGLNALTLAVSLSGAVITCTVTYNDAHAALGAGPDTVTGSATIGVGFSITNYTATGAFTGTAPTLAVTAGSTIV